MAILEEGGGKKKKENRILFGFLEGGSRGRPALAGLVPTAGRGTCCLPIADIPAPSSLPMTSRSVAMAMPALPAQAQVGIQSPGILRKEDARPLRPLCPN